MKINLFAAICLLLPFSTFAIEKIILLNEGGWQQDNGRITYFEDGKIISNKWFRDVNGSKLGDTPNDIIQINDNLIAISVNWSNIVQFINPQGKAVAATEDVPNNRALATDGNYVYLSSFGHECGTVNGLREFTKGFVAKIDIRTFKVVDAVEVGYEPEGIAYYKGKLFVANTGGYAFQENHEYEQTIDVIDAATMKKVRSIDTKQINLCGKMSQSGRFLCVSSPGDHYEVPAATVIVDCEAAISNRPDSECFVLLEYAATNSCTTTDGKFFAIGSRYSYYTDSYEFNYITIDPVEVMKSQGSAGLFESMPGTLISDLKSFSMPYGIYVNPYTGYIYATDAGAFTSKGQLYQWSPKGEFIGKHKVYVNPSHFLALPPDGHFSGITAPEIETEESNDAPVYNLQGIRVTNLIPGNLYISKGRKFIYR